MYALPGSSHTVCDLHLHSPDNKRSHWPGRRDQRNPVHRDRPGSARKSPPGPLDLQKHWWPRVGQYGKVVRNLTVVPNAGPSDGVCRLRSENGFGHSEPWPLFAGGGKGCLEPSGCLLEDGSGGWPFGCWLPSGPPPPVGWERKRSRSRAVPGAPGRLSRWRPWRGMVQGPGTAVKDRGTVTWLILPVVICLSQRLSHACLSTYFNTVKLRMAHYIGYYLLDHTKLLG